MDLLAHFHREVIAFESTVRQVEGAEAPVVPSCSGWTVSDLVLHLGGVHRLIIHIISTGLRQPPNFADITFLDLPEEHDGWPTQHSAPTHGPVLPSLLDWFADGAATLAYLFATHAPNEAVWTWSPDQSVAFWLRMQTIEAAVHRWDAEGAIGTCTPMDPELAADSIRHTLEIMVPFRRMMKQAPPGSGERYQFSQTDGPGTWTISFDPDSTHVTNEPGDVRLFGTASDLMLYLWHRIPATHLETRGDQTVLDRYFTLAPPV